MRHAGRTSALTNSRIETNEDSGEWPGLSPFRLLSGCLGLPEASCSIRWLLSVSVEVDRSPVRPADGGCRSAGQPTAGNQPLQRDAEGPDQVEAMGLEPTTPCLQSTCSSQLSYAPV